jgi:hypothetical protein
VVPREGAVSGRLPAAVTGWSHQTPITADVWAQNHPPRAKLFPRGSAAARSTPVLPLIVTGCGLDPAPPWNLQASPACRGDERSWRMPQTRTSDTEKQAQAARPIATRDRVAVRQDADLPGSTPPRRRHPSTRMVHSAGSHTTATNSLPTAAVMPMASAPQDATRAVHPRHTPCDASAGATR